MIKKGVYTADIAQLSTNGAAFSAASFANGVGNAMQIPYHLTALEQSYVDATTKGTVLVTFKASAANTGRHPVFKAARELCYQQLLPIVQSATAHGSRVLLYFATDSDITRFIKFDNVYFLMGTLDAKDGLRGRLQTRQRMPRNSSRVIHDLSTLKAMAAIKPFEITICADSAYGLSDAEFLSVPEIAGSDEVYNIMFMPGAIVAYGVVHKHGNHKVQYDISTYPKNEFYHIERNGPMVHVGFLSDAGAGEGEYEHSLETWSSKSRAGLEGPKYSWVNETWFFSAEMCVYKLAPAASLQPFSVRYNVPKVDKHYLALDLDSVVAMGIGGAKRKWKGVFRGDLKEEFKAVRDVWVQATQQYLDRTFSESEDPEKIMRTLHTHMHKTISAAVAAAKNDGSYVNKELDDSLQHALPMFMLLAKRERDHYLDVKIDAVSNASWFEDMLTRVFGINGKLDKFMKWLKDYSSEHKYMLPGLDTFVSRFVPTRCKALKIVPRVPLRVDKIAADYLALTPLVKQTAVRQLRALGRMAVDVQGLGDCALEAFCYFYGALDTVSDMRKKLVKYMVEFMPDVYHPDYVNPGVSLPMEAFECLAKVYKKPPIRVENALRREDGLPQLPDNVFVELMRTRADEPLVVLADGHYYAYSSAEPKHDGQLKLEAVERAYLRGLPKQECEVFYWGSGDAYHIPKLLDEFPYVTMHAYDKAKPKVLHSRLIWHETFIDDAVAATFPPFSHFIVDIRRTQDGLVTPWCVAMDNRDVRRWLDMAQASSALLKAMPWWGPERYSGCFEGWEHPGTLVGMLAQPAYDGLELRAVVQSCGRNRGGVIPTRQFFEYLATARSARHNGELYQSKRLHTYLKQAKVDRDDVDDDSDCDDSDGTASCSDVDTLDHEDEDRMCPCGLSPAGVRCAGCDDARLKFNAELQFRGDEIAHGLLRLDEKGMPVPPHTVAYDDGKRVKPMEFAPGYLDDLRLRIMQMMEQAGGLGKLGKKTWAVYEPQLKGLRGHKFNLNAMVINGYAGCGKSEVLRAIAETLVDDGKKVLIYLPVKKIMPDYDSLVSNAVSKAYVRVKTTHHALVEAEKFVPDYVLYDEMGMVDICGSLLIATKAPDAKHIFAGDIFQTRLRTTEGRDAFEFLQGFPTYWLTANFRNPANVVETANRLLRAQNAKPMIPMSTKKGHVYVTDATSAAGDWVDQVKSEHGFDVTLWHQMTFSDATGAFVQPVEDGVKMPTVRSCQGMTVDNAVLHIGPNCSALMRNAAMMLVALTRARYNLVIVVHSVGQNSFPVGVQYANSWCTLRGGRSLPRDAAVSVFDVLLDNTVSVKRFADNLGVSFSQALDLLGSPMAIPDASKLAPELIDPDTPEGGYKPGVGALDVYKDEHWQPDSSAWLLEQAQNSKLKDGAYRLREKPLNSLPTGDIVTEHVVHPLSANSVLQVGTEAMMERTLMQRVAAKTVDKPATPDLIAEIDTKIREFHADTKGRAEPDTSTMRELERFSWQAHAKHYANRFKGDREALGPEVSRFGALPGLRAMPARVRAYVKQQVKVTNVNKVTDYSKPGQSINAASVENIMAFAAMIRMFAAVDLATYAAGRGSSKVLLKQRLADDDFRARVAGELARFKNANLRYLDGVGMDSGQTEAGWYAYFAHLERLLYLSDILCAEFGFLFADMIQYFIDANLQVKVVGEFIDAVSKWQTPSGCSFTFDVTTFQSVFYGWLTVRNAGECVRFHGGDDGGIAGYGLTPDVEGLRLLERMTNVSLLSVDCTEGYFEFCGDIIVAQQEDVRIAEFVTRKAFKLLRTIIRSEHHLTELHAEARRIGATGVETIELNAQALALDGVPYKDALYQVEALRDAVLSMGRSSVSQLMSNLERVVLPIPKMDRPYLF